MKKILMTITLCSLLFAGCNPDEIPGTPYNKADYVYFETDLSGSVNVSFSPASSTTADRAITRIVQAVGKLVDYDRTFKIEAVMDPSMESGFDVSKLIELEEDTYTIKGGEVSTTLSFKIINDGQYLSQYKGRDIIILVRMVATDDFSLGFTKQTLTCRLWVSGDYK